MSSTHNGDQQDPANATAKKNGRGYMDEIWRTIGTSIATGIAIVITATPLAAWYVSTSIDHAITKALDPIKRTQDRQSVAMAFLIDKAGAPITDAEKKAFERLLDQVSFQNMTKRIESLAKQSEDRDLKDLEAKGKLILTSEVRTGLTWDRGSKAAQIRYFQSTDPTLDFRKIDFFTPGKDGDQGCRSRNLDLPVLPGLVVKVCVADHFHVENRLEFIVVRQSDNETTASPPLSD